MRYYTQLQVDELFSSSYLGACVNYQVVHEAGCKVREESKQIEVRVVEVESWHSTLQIRCDVAR